MNKFDKPLKPTMKRANFVLPRHWNVLKKASTVADSTVQTVRTLLNTHKCTLVIIVMVNRHMDHNRIFIDTIDSLPHHHHRPCQNHDTITTNN